jgi:murein DD-endopeptidase MepM/ murein hydrolase activator NlpD
MVQMLLTCVSLFAAPVNGTVVQNFRPPPCHYCAGHRGVTVAVQEGSPVRAISDGVISFAGDVAGTTYVVLQFTPDLRLTYGRLRDRESSSGVAMETGDQVIRGQILGHTRSVVYLGVRRGIEALNPLPYVGARRGQLVAPNGRRCGLALGNVSQSR